MVGIFVSVDFRIGWSAGVEDRLRWSLLVMSGLVRCSLATQPLPPAGTQWRCRQLQRGHCRVDAAPPGRALTMDKSS